MQLDEDDVCTYCIKDKTDEEREIDKQIINLSCYVRKEQIEQFSHLLHQKAHLALAARTLQMNRRYEITTTSEEETYAVLATVAQSREWEENDITKWNEQIEKHRNHPFAGDETTRESRKTGRPAGHGDRNCSIRVEICFCAASKKARS
jgi:hypothetical protein